MICNDSYMIANLANRIKKIREDAGDNRNIDAKKVGISRPAYVKWEAGDTSEPTLETHIKCPDCREFILKDARVCKHCGCKLLPQ